jgi:hypothetical protein
LLPKLASLGEDISVAAVLDHFTAWLLRTFLLTKDHGHGFILLAPILYLIIFFPVVLGAVEGRYFLSFFFLNQVGAFFGIHKLLLLNIKFRE